MSDNPRVTQTTVCLLWPAQEQIKLKLSPFPYVAMTRDQAAARPGAEALSTGTEVTISGTEGEWNIARRTAGQPFLVRSSDLT